VGNDVCSGAPSGTGERRRRRHPHVRSDGPLSQPADASAAATESAAGPGRRHTSRHERCRRASAPPPPRPPAPLPQPPTVVAGVVSSATAATAATTEGAAGCRNRRRHHRRRQRRHRAAGITTGALALTAGRCLCERGRPGVGCSRRGWRATLGVCPAGRGGLKRFQHARRRQRGREGMSRRPQQGRLEGAAVCCRKDGTEAHERRPGAAEFFGGPGTPAGVSVVCD